ncbi:MAG: hypothetical protein O2971_09160 [Proteobacteria bacterium]|nr:hypothetical protein [Pseudomonadota bacterium]
MTVLERITSEYSDTEDRIRLTAVTDSNATLILWLTQRLLVRLLGHFLNWLEHEAPEITHSTAIDSRAKSTLQGIAQQSAQAELPKQAAVAPNPESQHWLIREIDIKNGQDVVLLVFKCADGQRAEMSFSTQQLRQWLGILHTLWVEAEWPMTLWPEWMDGDLQTEIGTPDSPLH